MDIVRIAVISDIHSDSLTFRRVLKAIDREAVDELWCLGDIVGLGGRQPAEAVSQARMHCAVALGGNHDAWVAGSLPLDMLPLPRHQQELEWQREALSDDQLRWLSERPAEGERARVGLWHGDADDPVSGGVWDRRGAERQLEQQPTAIGLVGHTHRPAFADLRKGQLTWRSPPPSSVELGGGTRCVLNPGAVLRTGRWLDLDLKAGHATWRCLPS
jgi:predicted phosphodiesterase